jgi:hypothetical protein
MWPDSSSYPPQLKHRRTELTKRAGGTSKATLLLSPLGMKIGSVGRSNMSRRSFGCAGLDILKRMFCTAIKADLLFKSA